MGDNTEMIARGTRLAGCLFCDIAAGDKPAYVVLSDEVAAAFLDTRPVFKGHVLVVPHAHVETLADLPHETVGPFFERVQAVARAVEEGVDAAGTFVAINNRVSQSVPHLHVHVVPRNRKDGLRGFFWPRVKYADDVETEDYAARVRDALKKSTT
ncbi:HIT family protein [Planotetraspora sp. A-T 1434]|uniref:HIT family protein n=1 Tax=Planotetraspora sp. A-T 1434 TaxID=2979219 RepID=UPI0028FC17B0|nr:HIT family protein [Planotetraspora sp. A-T 1434]